MRQVSRARSTQTAHFYEILLKLKLSQRSGFSCGLISRRKRNDSLQSAEKRGRPALKWR